MGSINIELEANAWGEAPADPAELKAVAGTNGKIDVIAFDDTTEEEVQTYFKLPAVFDPAGNVTFEIEGFAATADGNKIRFKIFYSPDNEGESWDAAYADSNSGDKATDADPDEYDYTAFTVSAATLGWAADDLIRLKLSRVAIGAGSKVVGDYHVTHFRMRIPTL